ncbi:MAG: cytochrome c biogenesis protein CcsA [Cyanobacteria bacterium J06633_2]
MKPFKFLVGLLLGALILILPLSQFQPDPLDSLKTLTVQLDGRKKPLDTVALETVEKLHGSARYKQADGETLNYLQTYLSMEANDRDWNQEPFILFSYPPLKEDVGIDPERKYFTFRELLTSESLARVINVAHRKQADDQDLTRNEREALTIEDRVTLLYRTVGTSSLPIVPHPDDAKGTWVTLPDAPKLYEAEQVAPLMAQFELLKQGYRISQEHLDAVGSMATELHNGLAALSPEVYPSDRIMEREVYYNGFHPFAKAWMLYGLAFIVMLGALWMKVLDNLGLYWTSLGLFVAGISIQTYGFFLRMQIAGRPPVTNMYESVVWVGLGVAAIALFFEFTSRAKYYLLAAAPLSVLCLVLADRLPAVLDPSISPLVPVLRDNFWLSIHVPTITLGYASFALAMGLGHVALGHYLFAPNATERIRNIAQFNYRVLQVGVLLLTTGIILGGIWAHFSWGRFWGWDPKETWALIALMCYLVPLHGRLVGWIGNFGISVTSVVSFNAVLMAWYGVNFELGTGLHSYGFGTGGSELIVGAFVGLDLLFVLVAAIRYKRWWPEWGTSENATIEPTLATESVSTSSESA